MLNPFAPSPPPVSHGVTSQLASSTRQMKEFAMLNFQSSSDNMRGFNSPVKEISRIYESLHAVCWHSSHGPCVVLAMWHLPWRCSKHD